MNDKYLKICARIRESIKASDYAGFDPFDSLNSTLFKKTSLYNYEFLRLLWIQFGKNSPVNLRPLLGVPRKRNPKGVGLCVLGLLQDYQRDGNFEHIKEVQLLCHWLIGQKSNPADWPHPCWGYHFDWQARAFFVPAGKPNIISTVYVARALFEAGTVINDVKLVETALQSAKFISDCLYTESENRCFYAYIPGEKTFVHNASLWGAAWCIFCGVKLQSVQLIQQALAVVRQSVNEQMEDGAWVYGARGHHAFIDGFHTGYNLEALQLVKDSLNTSEFDDSIRRGYSYYIKNLIETSGVAKYYSNSVYPLDMHSFAQGMLTVLKVGKSQSDIELARLILNKALEFLYDENSGFFYYRRHKYFFNKINYIRWTQAWAYYGMAYFNRTLNELENQDGQN